MKIRFFIFMSLLLILQNCALKSGHYGSIMELRKESSFEYSEQIIDGVVGLIDEAQLPVLYYVEAGQSNWGTQYNGSVSGVINPPWAADSTVLSPAGSGGENWGLSLQLNDFGPAALTRVTALYAFLCFPLEIGNGALPNGALYTIVEKTNKPEQFLLSKKLNDQSYLGVTRKTQLEFYKFSRDVYYWTRHAAPDPTDLDSAAGQLYYFFARYPSIESQLADAVLSASKAEADFENALSGYSQASEQVSKMESDFRTSSDESKLLIAILEDAYKQRDMLYNQMGGAFQSRKTKREQLKELEREAVHLLQVLESTVKFIKSVDPQGELIDVSAILDPFYERMNGIIEMNEDFLEQAQYQIPSDEGISAEESVDKLYRERFEALPERYNTLLQSQN